MSWRPFTRWRGPVARMLMRAGIIAGALVIVLAIVLALAVALVDWNALRGPAVRVAAAKLGRPVRIDGVLDVRLHSLTPTVVIDGLDIGNPRWVTTASLPPTQAAGGVVSMAHVERVTFRIKLLPLLSGHVVLPSVRIERANFHLLRDAQGRINWTAGRAGRPENGAAPRFPVIQQLQLTQGQLQFYDVRRQLEFIGTLAAAQVSDARRQARPFRLVADGQVNQKPARLEVRGEALRQARHDRPYPFDMDLTASDLHVMARGTIAQPFDFGAVRGSFTARGQDLADLYLISGLAFPNTPPFHMTGRLARQGTQFVFSDIAGTVGNSDMRGDVTVELKGVRPLVSAQVSSQSLDLDDVATWFGGAPSLKSAGTASANERAAQRRSVGTKRVFPDAQLRVERMRAMDAQVQYHATAVRSARLPIHAMTLSLRLEDGVLSLEPFSLDLAPGKAEGQLRLDAREDTARTALDARITGVDLEQFKGKSEKEAPFAGLLRGRVKLSGAGNSVHRFISSSAGAVTLIVPRGEVRETFAELTGVNVSRSLGLLLKQDDERTSVRCGVADLRAEKGTLQVQNLVFDTDNVLITGTGAIHLDDETYDLSLRGQPKKLRLLRLKSRVAVRGPLLHPSFGIGTAAETFEQGGVAAALGALGGPLALMVAFVDPGLARDADCTALLAEARAGGAPVKKSEIAATAKP